MRFVVALVLTLSMLGHAVPAWASQEPYQWADDMSVYGYTDEAVTVSMLAGDLGVEPQYAAALAMGVDSLSQGGYGAKLTASQLGNLASGWHQYLTSKGQWDSFTDAVTGMGEVAGGVLFDMRPLYDMLGFATLAEEESWPDIAANTFGTHPVLVSGIAVRAGKPDVFGTWYNAQGPLTRAAMDSIARDPGGRWKVVRSEGGAFSGVGSAYYYSQGGYERIYCAECGAYLATGGSYSWIYYQSSTNSQLPMFYNLEGWLGTHILSCDTEGEAATVIENLATKGGIGHMLLAAAALTNPGGVVLGAADAWGVPGVLPPGVIHDQLAFADSWGDSLSETADELGSVVASLTAPGASLLERGLGGVAGFLRDVADWLASVWDMAQAWVQYVFVPSDEWLRFAFPDELQRISGIVQSRFPLVYVTQARDLLSEYGVE